jgi:exopolyphosphatase/guanosine-5'-triphosphate,3'-diphosphate pyrophosphatase
MASRDNCHAVIEFGSNTVNLAVFEIAGDRIAEKYKEKEFLGVIRYIENGRLSEEGMQKSVETLKAMKYTAASMASGVDCIATASLRGVSNSAEVEERFREETGLPFRVVSPEDEAYYDYLGVIHAMDVRDAVAADIGGGSMEIIHIAERKLKNSVTVPVGALKLCMEYVKNKIPDPGEMLRIEKRLQEYLGPCLWLYGVGCDTLCTIGGTARAVAKLRRAVFDTPEENDAYDAADLERLVDYIRTLGHACDEFIEDLAKDHADTLIPALIALNLIAKKTGVKKVASSRYGVREGFIIKNVMRRGE